jgi:hypothetical protein
VLATVPITSSPRQMALSGDGATMWIGFDGKSTIQKFSVASTPPVPGATYSPLGTSTYVNDLVALPGSATSIAGCFGAASVAVIDDGVARPTIHTQSFITKLEVGPSGTLFGYDGMSSAYTFYSFAITASGVTQLSAQEGLMGVFQNDMHYYQGRIYADQGEVIDVSDPTNPIRAGKFDFNGFVAPRSANRVLMLTAGTLTTTAQLRILDSGTFTQVASLSLGSGAGGITQLSNLVYLGDDGVAFLSPTSVGTGNVYIFRSPLIASPP